MNTIIESLNCSQCGAEHRFVTNSIRVALVAAETNGWALGGLTAQWWWGPVQFLWCARCLTRPIFPYAMMARN